MADDGLAGEKVAGGNARIFFMQDGKPVASITQGAQGLGETATNALLLADGLARASGKTASEWVAPPWVSEAIPVARVGLAPHPEPGFHTLTIQVGETQIGLALHEATLDQLRTALIALGAPEGVQH